jgi:hypothetical protein|nr:MAG TPA: hypothetical protein [Caudoviricetes sp.]
MKENNYRYKIVSIKNANLKNQAKNVYICPIDIEKCPLCGKKLNKNYVMGIQINSTHCIKTVGKYCSNENCDIFFSKDAELFTNLEKTKYDKNAYLLHQPYKYENENFKDYYKLPSFYYHIILCNGKHIKNYFIVTRKKDVKKLPSGGVIHYSEPLALNLMTQFVLNNEFVEIDNEKFFIHFKSFKENNELRHISPSNSVEVKIVKNGGYYNPNKNFVIVDGLVFCEKSQRLEILRMSYDKENNLYFVDQKSYDNFKREHGIPIVRYVGSSRNGYCVLREHSLLNLLGYNVGEKDDLSETQRHVLLGKLVDLGFITVHSIVSLLESLIKRNGVNKPNARMKWQSDLEFIRNYKANPETFAFVKKIRRL